MRLLPSMNALPLLASPACNGIAAYVDHDVVDTLDDVAVLVPCWSNVPLHGDLSRKRMLVRSVVKNKNPHPEGPGAVPGFPSRELLPAVAAPAIPQTEELH